MNFLDISDEIKNPPINSGWYYTYFILSLIYIIFSIIYFYYSRQDFCSTNSWKWGKISCGLFLFALFFKAVGYCVSGSLIIKENELITSYENCDKSFKNQTTDFATAFLYLFIKYENSKEKGKDPNQLFNTYSKIFMVFSSFPGYCISAAYCMIFYNWCSICIEAMEKNSYVYIKSRCVFTSLLIGICVCFILTTFLFIFLGGDQFHIAEAVFATIRDITLSIAFIIYLAKMWQVFADPCGSVKAFFKKICCCSCSNNSKNPREESLTKFINYEQAYDDDKNSESSQRSNRFTPNTASRDDSYETALVIMCLSIIFGLIVRSISIVVYTIMTNSVKHDGTICDAVGNPEYTTKYLGVFILETILSELLPVLAIITYRISHPARTQTREADLGF